ncbi:MAG TPA: peptidoglycan-binding domain-containing protein [Solirubrobacteraceae bacterium]|nr:peptidoglycan-binding domain-containing protein [Solirubrobacteraceae bacterium]
MIHASRAGHGSLVWGHGRLRLLLIALGALVATVALAGAARGATGGVTGAPPPGASKAHQPPAHKSQGNALGSRGMWIWYISQSSGGSLASIVATAHAYGISTLMIKSGDGAGAWSQFNSQVVAYLHAKGLRACAWQYVYGSQPIAEAEVGAAAVHAGADCLLIDAESEYEGKYVQAQQYVKKLRQLIGTGFPVGLAGFPYVDYHPAFPYSVFLGAGGAQYNVPQMYWPDIGTTVDYVYSHTYEFNTLYGRPIEPLGEVAGNPPPHQIVRFRQMSRAYGAPGVSWWDWQESSQRDWNAVGQSVGNLSGFAADPTMPVLSVKSAGGIWAGDLVLWAQEHLYKAQGPMTIDGSFGNQTQTAVEQFQAAHGLPVTGMVDPATWQALLRYQPVTVTWVTKRHKTVAVAGRAGGPITLAVPASAHLPAVRYEIPRDLGAGRPR